MKKKINSEKSLIEIELLKLQGIKNQVNDAIEYYNEKFKEIIEVEKELRKKLKEIKITKDRLEK